LKLGQDIRLGAIQHDLMSGHHDDAVNQLQQFGLVGHKHQHVRGFEGGFQRTFNLRAITTISSINKDRSTNLEYTNKGECGQTKRLRGY